MPVDINLTPPRANTSGCDGAFTEAAVGAPLARRPGGVDDFAAFPAGSIALIQRGGCSFALKAYNAQAAGASAVIIFNQGNTPDRSGPFVDVTAAAPAGSAVDGPLTVPVVGASFADGTALAQPGSTARISVRLEERFSENVIAEKAGRRRRQRRHGRRPPRLGARRTGHQRQRQRFGRAARDRPEPRQPPPAQHPAVRLVGCGGARPGRVHGVGRAAAARGSWTRSRCTSTST